MARDVETHKDRKCVARERRSARSCVGSGFPGCAANWDLENQLASSMNESSGTPSGLDAGAFAAALERLLAAGAAGSIAGTRRFATTIELVRA